MDKRSLERALMRFAELVTGTGARWVAGGSTALLLRGGRLASSPSDLDIYADQASIPPLHECLKPYSVDEPHLDATGRYHSLLSHYVVNGFSVELVGGFEVTAGQSVYRTEVDDYLFERSDRVVIQDMAVELIPLAHELLFNLMRNRDDRAQTIAELMSRDPARHLEQLTELARRNKLSSDLLDLAVSWLDSARPPSAEAVDAP